MSYKLRPYQQKALDLAKLSLRDGHKKILLFMATGAGKGLLMSQIVSDSLRKGNKVLTIMRRVQVVNQTASNYKKYHGTDSGLIMASHKISPEKRSQICSIDTVIRRIEKGEIDFLKQFQLVVVDESHDCTSPSYQEFFKFLGEKIYLGFSATPFKVGKKVHSFWDCVVKPIETHELRDQGFLTDAKVYVPTDIDLENIKMISGDYAQNQLSEKMQEMKIVGDVVENYKKYGQNKPGICFCVDKNHSMLMAEMFNQAGIPAAHCDESTKQAERDLTISKLKSGEIKIISNVNIFSTGVDIPCLEIGLMARPTKSEILFIQQLGRILRPYRKCGKCKSQYDNSPQCPVCGYDRPEYIKESATIIDFGNNTSRFGLPFDIRRAVITEEKEEKENVRKVLLVKTCKHCFMVYDAKLARCPNCEGAETKERVYKTEDGELILYNEFDAIRATFTHLCRMELERRWKPNSKHFKMYEKYGEQYMKFQKEFKIPAWIPKVYAKSVEEKNGKIYK